MSTVQQTSAKRVLFLSRTPKKFSYFSEVSKWLSPEIDARVLNYRQLERGGPVQVIPNDVRRALVDAAMKELLYARQSSMSKAIGRVVRPLIRRMVKSYYSRLYNLLLKEPPELVCLWNGNKIHDLIFHAVNRDFAIPVCYFENGVIPNSTTMDFAGINANNSVPRHSDAFDVYSSENLHVEQHQGRAYNGTKKYSESLPEHYILVPFQLDRDSQILYHSLWIRHMRHLVAMCSEALDASEQKELHLVFREHPSCRTRYDDLYRFADSKANISFNCEDALTDAIDNAKAVMTINSTVGLDALIRHKPVIVLGSAFYGIDGLSTVAGDFDTLVSSLKNIEQGAVDKALVNRFFHYLSEEYVIAGDWRKPDEAHYSAIQSRFSQFFSDSPNTPSQNQTPDERPALHPSLEAIFND